MLAILAICLTKLVKQYNLQFYNKLIEVTGSN